MSSEEVLVEQTLVEIIEIDEDGVVFGGGERESGTMKDIVAVTLFSNGMVMAFNADGKQVPEAQGFLPVALPELAERLADEAEAWVADWKTKERVPVNPQAIVAMAPTVSCLRYRIDDPPDFEDNLTCSHVRVTVFSGPRDGSRGNCGQLTLDREGFRALQSLIMPVSSSSRSRTIVEVGAGELALVYERGGDPAREDGE